VFGRGIVTVVLSLGATYGIFVIVMSLLAQWLRSRHCKAEARASQQSAIGRQAVYAIKHNHRRGRYRGAACEVRSVASKRPGAFVLGLTILVQTEAALLLACSVAFPSIPPRPLGIGNQSYPYVIAMKIGRWL
jgi:hypothetical protein